MRRADVQSFDFDPGHANTICARANSIGQGGAIDKQKFGWPRLDFLNEISASPDISETAMHSEKTGTTTLTGLEQLDPGKAIPGASFPAGYRQVG